jgi:4-hydroxybenzoate polyprenyltransferase
MMRTNTNKTTELLVTLRPHHWIKNTFVFAPLVFSGRFTHIDMCLKAMLAFFSFCLVSSAVYAVNDVCDQEEDRRHPTKKFRPIAVGAMSSGSAIIMSALLLVPGLILAGFLNWSVMLIILIYFLINIAYSLFIKHIAILDVLTISAGFVLRIIGGGMSISVVPSYWLVLCTVMISIFIGFTKRRVELLAIDIDKNNSRPVLKDYSISFLDQVIPMVTGATILAYALYTVDEHTLMVLGTRAMLLTLPFVIYGLLRYIYIIYHLKQCADPTENLIRDIPTIINLALWVVTSLLVVKYGSKIVFFR